MSEFKISDNFYLNDKPFQIISGSIHYFRVVPEYWKDRLEKLKNMGCNTVETYIPWNFHESVKGQFNWSGRHDVIKFIQTAQELGLYLIIRPSPYICAEWEFGGLPAWLNAEDSMRLRCSYKPYLDHVKDYFNELIPKLVPYQIDHGGNIILMQIENEYGYFGNDTSYLKFLADLMRELGVTVPFVTSDGPWGAAFKTGQLPEALPTGNFGTFCHRQFEVMKKQIEGKKPLMCMEYWAGWFDAWGNKFKMRSSLQINKKDLDFTVKNGHHINIYMFHGGTNFGFMNGSNYYSRLTPDTTSYDYDAPLSEDGSLTKKYREFRKIIKKYKDVPDVEFTTEIKHKAYGKICWNKTADLFENLKIISTAQESLSPLSMEKAGQATGYILYRTQLKDDESLSQIIFKKCADRIHGFINEKKIFTAFDKEICSEGHGVWPFNYKEGKVFNFKGNGGSKVEFLVENCGRVNFGHKLEDQKKGLVEDVLFNGHIHFGWKNYTLPLDDCQMNKLISEGVWNKTVKSENPAFFEFEFEVDEPCDTWLDFKGWGKGCAFVNGFNIGRFWKTGPQKKLYIPGPLLKNGKNKIIIFETEGLRKDSISLV